MTFGITVSGGTALHLVNGDMSDHAPWRDELPTRCGRLLVASNYFDDLADYRRSYNMHGRLCQQCEGGPEMTGYICKQCGGPAPTGVGYATTGRSAAKASAELSQCRCGYSQKEAAK